MLTPSQAVYTAGVVLPQPVSSCRYWHRNLNPKKLIEVKFSHLGKNMTMQRTLRLYKLPDKPQTAGFRKVTSKDLPACRKLLEVRAYSFISCLLLLTLCILHTGYNYPLRNLLKELIFLSYIKETWSIDMTFMNDSKITFKHVCY